MIPRLAVPETIYQAIYRPGAGWAAPGPADRATSPQATPAAQTTAVTVPW